MDSDLSINQILKYNTTKLTNKYIVPPDFNGSPSDKRLAEDILSQAIDSLGRLSAICQRLAKPITTSKQLLNSDRQALYLQKDPTANNNRGQVIGYLRVAHKHLYLYDENNVIRETDPLSVLDFFVHEEFQGRGNGYALFEYMMKDQGVEIHDLAIDSPSDRMLHFVRRRYNIEFVTQSNNFAVASTFFQRSSDNTGSANRLSPARSPVFGRHAAPKPRDEVGAIISGREPEYKELEKASGWPNKPSNTNNSNPNEKQLVNDSVQEDTEVAVELPLPKPSTERPNSLKIPTSVTPTGKVEPESRSPSRSDTVDGNTADQKYTKKGFLDMKFYHTKMW